MDAEIKEQFDEQLGIEPSAAVIGKSMELCDIYHVESAEEFVEQWTAFSITHLNGAEPTLDNLQEFERKVFQTRREKELAAANKKKPKYSSTALSSLAQFNAAAAVETETNPLAMYGVLDDQAMDDYINDLPKPKVCAINRDEDDAFDAHNSVYNTPKAKSSLAGTPVRNKDALFSPASYSPISGTPRSHRATQGSGKIVYTFGNPALISAAQWASQQQSQIHVRLLQGAGNNADAKYMHDKMREKCEIAGDRIFNIGKSLCRKVFGADALEYELNQVDMHTQNNAKMIGTIYCEHDGPLDSSSTLLVGSDEMRVRSARLNFSKAKSTAIFPGQVVMVSGVNPRGDRIIVDEVYTERQLEPPTTPKLAEQLSFVIAAGPFTHDDDLLYEPLHDLMTYLKEHKPDVLLLIGPFLSAKHKLVAGDIVLAETFESFFEKMIAGIIDIVGQSTTILIVTSHQDANAEPVYPTMPLLLKHTYPNVHMLPDPAMVNINGIILGVSATDIVDHLISSELAINAGEKVKRVINYLLQQGSFYPLNPPPEGKVCLDTVLANKFATIDSMPNILVLPSDQKCFLRIVNGCLAINPGRLADNKGGTFARFIIKPSTSKDETNIFNNIACQVRQI